MQLPLHAGSHGESRWDCTSNRLAGSTALDWTKLAQRINYISDLCHSRHLDPAVFECRFTESDIARLWRGMLTEAL